ncbi:hypothetical protein AAG906_025331 [Vitis piasezkii]
MDSSSWIRDGGRLTRVSDQLDQRLDQRDMDSQIVTVPAQESAQFDTTRPGDVGAISSVGMRPLRRYQTVGQTSGFYYPSSPHVQYRPPAPSRPMTPTYLHLRPTRQFSQLGMPLSRAFQKFMEGGLLTQLAPKPLPQPIPPRFRMDFHCSYHQGLGHDTDHCTALRHAIQDLIDQVPPPLGDIHHIDLIEDDSIHMLSWDDKLPEPIILHDSCEADGVSLGLQGRGIEIVTRSGRIAQPPPSVVRPFEGATSHDKVRRENDEVLRQLQSTQAHISIWRLLTSSSTHRDALIRALSHIKVETTTTLEGLIHMMTTDRVTCIGLDHVRPLYITVGCLGHKVPSILLDNGSALNVFPLATAIAFAYDSTKREVMGTLVIDLQIGPTTFSTLFQVLRIPTSFNLLLGRPWIHRVKFIHDGQVITVQSTGDMLAFSEPIQTLKIEDFCRDFVTMSFNQHNRSVCPTPFNYPIRPYRMSLTDYFVRGSEIRPRLEEMDNVVHTDGEIELQHLFHQLQLSDGAPSTYVSMAIALPSLDRASLLSLCFPEEVTDDGVVVDPTKMIDEVVPHDEY